MLPGREMQVKRGPGSFRTVCEYVHRSGCTINHAAEPPADTSAGRFPVETSTRLPRALPKTLDELSTGTPRTSTAGSDHARDVLQSVREPLPDDLVQALLDRLTDDLRHAHPAEAGRLLQLALQRLVEPHTPHGSTSCIPI